MSIDKRALRDYMYRSLGILQRQPRARLRRPIFVIGSGRSGTTLMAQILASHGEIAAFPGEANELWHPRAYPYRTRKIGTPPILFDPEEFTRQSLESWPRQHRRAIARTLAGFMMTSGRDKRLLLKSAMVSFMIEPLHELFPDAIFVHVYRNGIPVVASLTSKEWPKHRHQISKTDFRVQCAEYWASCLSEIQRASDTLGLRESGLFMDCQYERLCEDPEAVLLSLSGPLELDPNGYAFDPTSVQSRNAHVAYYAADPTWAPALATLTRIAADKPALRSLAIESNTSR